MTAEGRRPSIATAGLAGVIDRYLFFGVGLRLLAVTLIILVILTLENISRLAADVQRSDAPLRLLGRLSLALLPEHLSAALPIGLLLAVALTVRRMALLGEWQILQAAGMSRNRTLVAPFSVALLATGLVLADRLELRPAGGRALDAIYSDLRAGVFGVPLPIGEAVPLDDLTTLFASGAGEDAKLTGVMVQRGDHVFLASSARVTRNGAGEVVLILSHGINLVRLDGNSVRRMSFETMRIAGRPPVIGLVGNDFRHRLDRQPTSGLLRLIGGTDAAVGDAALMALVMRIDAALFCLLVPWIGVVLGLPAARLQTAVGIGSAILLVVAHLKSAAFVEDRFADHAIVAGLLHFLCWAGLVRGLLWLEARHGEGFAEELPRRLLWAWRAGWARLTASASIHRSRNDWRVERVGTCS